MLLREEVTGREGGDRKKLPRIGVDNRVVEVCFAPVVASKSPGPSALQCPSVFCLHIFHFLLPACQVTIISVRDPLWCHRSFPSASTGGSLGLQSGSGLADSMIM